MDTIPTIGQSPLMKDGVKYESFPKESAAANASKSQKRTPVYQA